MVFYIEKRNSLICNDYAGSITAFVYTIDGVKLKARHITAIPQGTGSSSSSTNYIMSKDSIDYIVRYTKKSVKLRTLMNIIKTRGYRRVS